MSDTPKLTPEDRGRLRDAIDAWADAPDSILTKFLEPALFASLRPLLPIPDSDSSLPDGLFAAAPMLLEFLGLPTSSACLMVNDPDETAREKIAHLVSAAADPKTPPDELLRLAADVERYVIMLPWDLYKRASDHVVMLWMHRIGAQAKVIETSQPATGETES